MIKNLMTRGANRSVPIALAISSGLITSGLLYSFLAGQPRATASTLEPMVVTRLAVDDSRPLSPSDLTIQEVERRPAGSYGSVGDVVGRLPLVNIPMGQPLLSSHLASHGALPGLWHRVQKGMRAVTVAINEVVGVGGFLKPGLHVDIIGVAQSGLNWESNTIAQDVPVLAIAQDDKDKKDSTRAQIATSATLLVSPQQAEAISLASERGRIRLVLRAANDHVMRSIAKPKPRAIAAPAWQREPRVVERRVTVYIPSKAAPAPAAPAPRPGIEVIRGATSEIVRP